jgi:hypothetical protein
MYITLFVLYCCNKLGDLIKEIVLLSFSGKIPDEQTALQLAPSAMAGLMPGQPTWPSNVISQVNIFNVFTSLAVVHLIFYIKVNL